VTPEFEQL
jgi:hypothetical protein